MPQVIQMRYMDETKLKALLERLFPGYPPQYRAEVGLTLSSKCLALRRAETGSMTPSQGAF
jgi:hypothetical protein